MHPSATNRQTVSAALIGLLLCSLCSCTLLRTPVTKQPAARHISILFTGNTRGIIEPQGCGCLRRGGLAPRASLIGAVRENRPGLLVVDTGDALFGKTRDVLKADYILACMNLIQTDLYNVTPQDFAAGTEYLQKQTALFSGTFLSSNIRSPASGKLLFSPGIITIAETVRIGVFGISDPDTIPEGLGHTIVCDDSITAATRAVAQLQGRGTDVIIMLSQLQAEDNVHVAREVSGINFILGSASPDIIQEPVFEGSTVMLSPGTDGAQAALLEITVNDVSAPYYYTADGHRSPAPETLEPGGQTNPTAHGKLSAAHPVAGTLQQANAFSYQITALDRKGGCDESVGLLVEQYKYEKLKKALAQKKQGLKKQLITVDLSGLSEQQRLMALRLMNDIPCRNSESIANLAADKLACRRLASVIVSGVKKGESEGAIRYKVLYEKGRTGKKFFLDKKP